MLLTNFIEIAKNAMNELAETNRNIGLLEQSITMQAFSAVALETQADAAEMMINEETGRKRQLLNHLRELSQECFERRNEVAALRNSAISEAMFYGKLAAEYQAVNNRESFDIAIELRNKARAEYDKYSVMANDLAQLAENINNTIAGESSPRLLPLTTLDDLPFESVSAQPAESAEQIFDRLVKAHTQDVIDYVVRHRDIRAQDDDEEVQQVLAEITAGRVNAEDVLQSFDEVLDQEFAFAFELLNAEYAVNPQKWQRELAECVEAYTN